MARYIEGENRQQSLLLPDCLEAYVSEDNPVRVVDVFIDELDLRAIGFAGPASTGRLAYALALWLGNRRSDIASPKPTAIDGNKIRVTQGKTGHVLGLEITPMLRECLDATDLTRKAILMTAYGEPFSPKSLTGRMADWTKAAGLAPGCTLHGLRKTLGKMLAESGATTRQLMDTLGHTDIKHSELYSRDAEQELLARDGMKGVVKLFNAKKKGGG